jgi:transposase
MKKIYSDEVVSEVVKLYKNGVSYSEVSMMMNIGRKNVKTILVEKNVWIEDRDKIKKEFSVDDIETIIKKYNEGLSAKKISIEFNVSISPIKRILKEKNILREGYSNGIKISLSEEQISLIKKLYLDDYKNSEEIGCQLGLTKSFIDKYLGLTMYRRNKSEGNSVGLVKRYRNISYDKYLNIEDDYMNCISELYITPDILRSFTKMIGQDVKLILKKSTLGKYRYVLCPRGNGIDTHRFWETLYKGNLPVVTESTWSAHIRKLGIPFLHLSEVGTAIKANEIDTSIPFMAENIETLWWPYWRALINSHL